MKWVLVILLLVLTLTTTNTHAGSITLAWDDYHSGFIGVQDQHRYFELYRYTNSQWSSYAIITDFSQNVSTYTDTSVDTVNNDYCYMLRAGIELTLAQNNIGVSRGNILYVDSEELDAGDYHLYQAFDQNASTYWYTRFFHVIDSYPHEFQLDLIQSYPIDTVVYTPRGDGINNGTIKGYAIYISDDKTSWGSAVSSGDLPSNLTTKSIQFTPKSGRYFRFVASSAITGEAWASAAEFSIYYNTHYAIPPNASLSPFSNITCYNHTPIPVLVQAGHPDNHILLSTSYDVYKDVDTINRELGNHD